MTQPTLLELAKQGNPKAIATLMNRQLQPKGITAKVALKGDCLQVMLEGEQVPDQQTLVDFISKGVASLKIQLVNVIKIYGRQKDAELPDWSKEIRLGEANSEVGNTETSISMKGIVLDFSIQTNHGIISGNDGRRYKFAGVDWNLPSTPKQGDRVDFNVSGDRATSIYRDLNFTQQFQTTKSRQTTGILALFLGGFGIHFFYLDAWGWGLISILFCWTYLPAIAGLILGIRYLTLTDNQFNHKISKLQGPFGVIEL